MNPKVIVGFTGTRRGMKPVQKTRVFSILHNLQDAIDETHHGDCIGADEEFHELCQILGLRIIIHPPSDDRFRAYCQMAYEIKEEKEYLARNRDIVRSSTLVITTPRTNNEERRSGTGYTTRYALRHRRDVIKVSPDGDLIPLRVKQIPFNDFWNGLPEEDRNA